MSVSALITRGRITTPVTRRKAKFITVTIGERAKLSIIAALNDLGPYEKLKDSDDKARHRRLSARLRASNTSTKPRRRQHASIVQAVKTDLSLDDQLTDLED